MDDVSSRAPLSGMSRCPQVADSRPISLYVQGATRRSTNTTALLGSLPPDAQPAEMWRAQGREQLEKLVDPLLQLVAEYGHKCGIDIDIRAPSPPPPAAAPTSVIDTDTNLKSKRRLTKSRTSAKKHKTSKQQQAPPPPRRPPPSSSAARVTTNSKRVLGIFGSEGCQSRALDAAYPEQSRENHTDLNAHLRAIIADSPQYQRHFTFLDMFNLTLQPPARSTDGYHYLSATNIEKANSIVRLMALLSAVD
jgi:hypothetical protein